MTDEPYQSLEDRAKAQRVARDQRLATLETALRTIQSAVPKYLKKEMTAEEFIDAVLAAADDREVVRAVREAKGKTPTGK